MNKSFTRQGWFKDTFVINLASTLTVLALAVIAIFFSHILSMVIIGVGIIFAPLMLLFSVFFARVIKNPSFGPQEFNSALWYWALIPAVIYLIIGIIVGRSKIFTELFDKFLEFFFKILE